MATKTISIMNDVYELMRRQKRTTESFSQLIRRIFKTKHSVMDFAGAWRHVSERKVEELKATVRTLRKRSTQELLAMQ